MAEMVPVEFWGWVIPKLKLQFPELIFIAEVYNPNEYRNYIFNGKFDYLYDKVGLYDKLRSILTENHDASDISHCWQAIEGIESNMLNFLENHDEQRIASDFFCRDAKRAFPAMIIAATLTKAPIMIYSGQELGEKGMENEGFSGKDGRTTIFDYWCIESVQNWFNKGKFGEDKLTEKQKLIRSFYRKLMNIVLTEKAITDGQLYDLEYANFYNPHFNTHKHFAYLRKYEDELLLIVINFNSNEANIKVAIPNEVFDFLQIENGKEVIVKDILNTDKQEFKTNLTSTEKFEVSLSKHSACILKIRYKD
jgi:glycosidase